MSVQPQPSRPAGLVAIIQNLSAILSPPGPCNPFGCQLVCFRNQELRLHRAASLCRAFFPLCSLAAASFSVFCNIGPTRREGAYASISYPCWFGSTGPPRRSRAAGLPGSLAGRPELLSLVPIGRPGQGLIMQLLPSRGNRPRESAFYFILNSTDSQTVEGLLLGWDRRLPCFVFLARSIPAP